jgi:hypothetical protein
MRFVLILLAMLAMTASAADITGTWKGTAETPNGTIERTFVFKTDGTKLTGETSSQMFGKSTITDGKVEGDSVTFKITVKFQDNEMQLEYKGKISGNSIKFHVEGANGISVDYDVKKVE